MPSWMRPRSGTTCCRLDIGSVARNPASLQLGFAAETWQPLQDALLRLAQGNAEVADSNRFGQKYVVLGTTQGPTGRSAPVVVVWIVLHGDVTPRFVTADPGAKS